MTLLSPTIPTMQTTRKLSASEFSMLAQAPDAVVPNPDFVTAIVAERDGRLLGRRFLCLVPHVEGEWQLPECDVPALESALDASIAAAGLSGVLRAAPVTADLTPYGYTPLQLLLWVKQPPQEAVHVA